MKKLSEKTFSEIRRWIFLNARNLDIARFQYFFENGSKEAVLEALTFYQNDDGGFGHGLELDNMNPKSSPVMTDWAVQILKSIDCDDAKQPLIQGIIRFIEHTEHFTERGFRYTIPSNKFYPHKPWFNYPASPNFPDDWDDEYYINSAFFRFVLKYFDCEHEIYKKALRAIDYRINNMRKFAEYCTYDNGIPVNIGQFMEADDWLSLITLVKEYGLRNDIECELLMQKYIEILKNSTCPEVSEKVLFDMKNKSISENELDKIVDRLTNDGIWCENGLFCKNIGEKDNLVWSVEDLWWEIMNVINDLKKLKDYGRI